MDCVGVEIGIESRLEEYIGVLRASGRKPSTLKGVGQSVRICAKWLRTQGIGTWDRVTPSAVAFSLSERRKNEKEKNSIYRRGNRDRYTVSQQ